MLGERTEARGTRRWWRCTRWWRVVGAEKPPETLIETRLRTRDLAEVSVEGSTRLEEGRGEEEVRRGQEGQCQ